MSPHLDHVLSLPEDERLLWLASFRLANPGLADLLQELLEEHRALSRAQFLEHSPVHPALESSLAGQTIGPYKLISPIGEGGMGAVWLAERNDGRFERRVAVKFLHFSVARGLERFKREGKILGRLAHPNIAELIDAGVTASGDPYLVLELVNGEHIDVYCDRHGLDVNARIKLFLDVLEAVAHAHAKLIVHRDIKPSNVLVRDDGQVKLLDFGIAKLLARADDAGMPSLEGAEALTPLFAAPEQVGGGPVTTATDIYSLGVLLFLLLSGQHPAGPGPHSPANLIKAIVDTGPPRASDAVGASDKALSDRRGATPEKLRRLLRGDLDTIVAKALKKAPEERYRSVTAMAADLNCYLKHEPISALPDTFAYRAAKFVRRNRTLVALTSVAFVLVIGSLSGGLYLANRERRSVERRFAQVRKLANKFISLDNEIRGIPGSTKVRMEMVRDSLEYLTSLGSDIRGDRDMALEIAYAYVRVAHAQGDPTSPNLGQFAEAETSLRHAAGFIDPILSEEPRNPRALFIATTIAHDRMVLANNRNDNLEALKQAAIAVSLIESFLNTRPVEVHDLYSMRYFYVNVGYTYYLARRFADAIRYSQRALDIPLPGPNADALRGEALSSLGAARWQSGDLDGALKTAREAIELERAEATNGHAAILINLSNGMGLEGMILGKKDAEASFGRSREAIASFQKALGIADDLSNKDPLDYLGRHHVAIFGLELGNVLRHYDPPKALAIYDHALARIREVEINASSQSDQAELLAASSYPVRWLGRKEEAEQRIAKALDLLSHAGRYPADKVEPMNDVYDVLRAQADDYAETRRTSDAIESYRQLLDRLMTWRPDPQNDFRDAVCLCRTWVRLGELYRLSGRKDDASKLENLRADIWKRWRGRLPGAPFLLNQSLSQITPPQLSTGGASRAKDRE